MKTVQSMTAVLMFLLIQVTSNTLFANDTIKIAKSSQLINDSTEYELIVFDPGYDAYLIMQPSKDFYSETYYKHWNALYVNEWNFRCMSLGKSTLYETQIDYEQQVEYGIDLEYRLYYFFRYFETKNRVVLISRGR
jgi:hypothetical protein